MKEKPIAQVRHLTKIIGGKRIVDQVDMDLYPGEIFGFLGPNGAGKTTTIRMMVGLMSVSEGEVIIDGISLKKNFEKAISRVGAIVENPEMYKFLTGYQNLVHFARMCDGVKKERIDEVVRLVGLAERIHDKVKTYSLGMRQRLGIAQALLHQPKLLILDEPTNGLDPAGIREIRHYLRRLAREENLAILVSSHILAEMELMCDRIGIIREGKLIIVQEVRDLVEKNQGDVMVTFRVHPLDQAKALLSEWMTKQPPKVVDECIQLTVDQEQIPFLNAKLVENGIQVYEIRMESKNLEEQFLELTEGGVLP